MVILVDLRLSMKDTPCEETGPFFAYWNTVVDQFLTISGDQAWSSWSHLLDSVKSVEHLGKERNGVTAIMTAVDFISRLRSITPAWVMELGRKEKKQ